MKKISLLFIFSLIFVASVIAEEPPPKNMQWSSPINSKNCVLFVGDYNYPAGLAYIFPGPDIKEGEYFLIDLATTLGKITFATVQSLKLSKIGFQVYYDTTNRFVYRVYVPFN